MEKYRAKMTLPVFLPGSNRDWEEVKGIATITNDGEIHIRLSDIEDADKLVALAEQGIMYQVSFDYRMETDILQKVNDRYKKIYDTHEMLLTEKEIIDGPDVPQK